MNRPAKTSLILLSFVTSVISLVMVMTVISNRTLTAVMTLILEISQKQPQRGIVIAVSLTIFAIAIISLVAAILSGRLHKTRITDNAVGSIDIGVDAIESIALNAARASQSGVKSAKARVAPFKGNKISVKLVVILFPDVEIPAMMTKVQERVKKDIERYTGISVGSVVVRVSKVENVAARVEH